MRKNSVRKWLHAVLDFLPLLVIPIFALAVRSDNNYQPISITTESWEVKELYETNEVNTTDDVQLNKMYHTDNLDFNANTLGNIDSFSISVLQCSGMNINGQFDLDEELVYEYNSNINNFIYVHCTSGDMFINLTNNNAYISMYFDGLNFDYGVSFYDVDFIINDNVDEFLIYVDDSGYDLPTKSDFNVYSYEYNEGHVYNDTDVGSQLVYTLYNTVDKYFNCTNLFNLEQVWNWVQLNLFGGNAPLMVYVVWQVIVYEFFMDLIFLLYSVFMFVIDFATNCIDRFTGRANRC